MSGKVIIFSAPSGSGKSTLIRSLMTAHPELRCVFSISCTTRLPRAGEVNGKDYYFVSRSDFEAKIARGEFVEYVEVYAGVYYGTLRSEVDARLSQGENVVLDVDVMGAMDVKALYGSTAVTIFIAPPSLEVLRERLVRRGTETPEVIATRLSRAAKELSYADRFDYVVVNDDLSTAQDDVYNIVSRCI